MKRFLSELRRRRVGRVAGFFLVTAWLAIEVADVIFPRLGLPDWSVTLVVGLAFVGFPVVLALAWAFDITPDGIRREAPTTPSAFPRRAPAAWVGLGILIGLVAFGGYAYIAAPSAEPDIDLDEGRIAVLPFEVRAGPDLQYLGEAFVDLLSAKLHHAGELSSVDPAALLGQVGSDPDARLDPDQAGRIALHFGAGHFVLGSILRLGQDLEIQARLYDADRRVVAAATVTTPEADLARAVDDLARQLLADRLKGPGAELARIAATATGSLPALKAFLQGEARLRRGDAHGAVAAFEEAVAIDSAFTYAWFRLAVARSWMPRTSPAYTATPDAAAAAMAAAHDLPERERTLLRLFDAYWSGDSVLAEELAWKILSAQPENLEARYYLGEVIFHGAGTHGRDIQDARAPLERTLALQPDHAFALIHLVDLALARGDAVAVDSFGRRLTALSVDLAPQVAAYRALLAGEPDTVHALTSALDRVPGEAITDIAWRATALTESARVADAFGRLLQAPGHSPAVRRGAARMRAAATAATGEWDRALAILQPYDDADDALFAASLLVAGRDAAPREPLRRLAPRLARSHTLEEGAPADQVDPEIWRAYVAGRAALLLDDDPALDAALDRLEGLGHRDGGDPLDRASYYTTALRAHHAAAMGRGAEAIALLTGSGAPLLRNHEAFLLASLLDANGRRDDARRWFHALPEFQDNVFAALPLITAARTRTTP